MIIAIEGPDAAGKATQARLLSEAMRGVGHRVEEEAFPRYQTDLGRFIANELKKPYGTGLTEGALQALFMADRLDYANVNRIIQTDVRFVFDRWSLSAAVSMAARYNDIRLIDVVLEQERNMVPTPDLTIVLNLSSRTCLQRIKARNALRDRNESEVEYIERTAYLYEQYSASSPKFVVGLNAERTVAEIHGKILEYVDSMNLVPG
jgi:dTMP kinase